MWHNFYKPACIFFPFQGDEEENNKEGGLLLSQINNRERHTWERQDYLLQTDMAERMIGENCYWYGEKYR